MHDKTYFFEVFFVVWKYNMILALRDLTACMKQKKNIFFYVLMNIGYFNTGFVFLQYKNTNRY
jgi:hypothetical protein